MTQSIGSRLKRRITRDLLNCTSWYNVHLSYTEACVGALIQTTTAALIPAVKPQVAQTSKV